MKILTVIEKNEIVGRGTVFTIDLKENDLPLIRSEFTKELMNKEVVIHRELYNVIGIESIATAESYVHKQIGILVKRNYRIQLF